jgi:pimeloyl-ACP methyl ester carboxylesterase
MKKYFNMIFLFLPFLLLSACQEPGHDVLEQSALSLSDDGSGPRITSAMSMAMALDLPPAMIQQATLTGHQAAAAELPGLGVIQPTRGSSFVVLSTGVVGSVAEPGTDLGTAGSPGDVVTLRLDLGVPQGAYWLTFDFQFLSAEYPDYIGSGIGDTFEVRVQQSSGVQVIPLASADHSFFHDASPSRAGGTGYDIYTADPAGVDTEFTFDGLADAGITARQKARIAVTPGQPLTVELEIRDGGDGMLDSAVILDNFELTSIELLDPNPELLSQWDGSVTTDITALAAGGRPIRGVTADGVTQALVRMRVPGRGVVSFTLEDGSAPADGGLSVIGASDRLSAVQVQAVEVAPGVYYAFALYRAPEDFNGGGDEELAQRSVRIRAQHTVGVASELEVEITRPPVVLVHGLWSGPLAWDAGSLMADERFTWFVADYASIYDAQAPFDPGYDLFSNRLAVVSAITDALASTRQQEIAATQVDVVAHGIGGLLARMYIASPPYYQYTNFFAGDVNRLITLNTPHVGTPMANASVEFRERVLTLPPSTRDNIANTLKQAGIHIFNGLLDDLAYGSNRIADLPETQVPSHALVATGARGMTRAQSLVAIPTHIRVLYMLIEIHHPDSANKPGPIRLSFIFGPNSQVFADEHDLFVEVASQRGGLPETATTTFSALPGPPYKSHFLVVANPAYQQRIVELLDEQVNGGSFAFLPPPGDVPLP